ncbi:hypothetical protein MNBD_NITROSPINAE03-1870 [hydrothermal vent metagenome]|uniref:Uncharacterized protein n=1 Tax=hydrothermal vent metagenome TaxID=652676 RepID=A0A3B1BI69_9ZZZZ
MGLIKKLAVVTAFFVFIFICSGILVYFAFYNSIDDLRSDLATATRAVRIELYNRGLVDDLTEKEIRYVYQKSCYRKCHGEAAMITAVLSPAGWFQVVERMRLKENVDITGREADVIKKYLDERYPLAKSAYSYETRKKVHHAVWRNDMGQGDIYCDIVYATPEYFKSIGAEHLIKEYDLANYHVFISGFTVHENTLDLINLDKVTTMRSGGRESSSSPPWNLRFQTADKHHFEGVVRFSKDAKSNVVDSDSKWFELVIKGVGGAENRVFRWMLPIQYPKEVTGAS